MKHWTEMLEKIFDDVESHNIPFEEKKKLYDLMAKMCETKKLEAVCSIHHGKK